VKVTWRSRTLPTKKKMTVESQVISAEEQAEEDPTKSMRKTFERAEESINTLVLNLYEMQQYEPKTEEEKENMTNIRLSLLNQLAEMREIRNQIKLYLQVADLGPDATEEEQRLLLRSHLGIDKDEVESKDERSVVEDKQTAVISVEEESTVENAEKFEVLQENDEQTDRSDIRMKILFNQVKEKVYKDAAYMISQHEDSPVFLLQLFRNASKLNSNYARQKILIALDQILCEEQQEDGDDSVDSLASVNSSPDRRLEELPARVVIPEVQDPESRANESNSSSFPVQIRGLRYDVSKYLDELADTAKSYTQTSLDSLKRFLLHLMFKGTLNDGAFERASENEFDECFKYFVDRAIGVQLQAELFQGVDAIVQQIVMEQSRTRKRNAILEGDAADESDSE